MVRECLDRGVHVFCEKPFCLDPSDSTSLAALARERRLVCQVGYHNRFVAAFAEAKRLLDADAIGRVTHVLAESYGPVVLQPKGGTWRSKKEQGGGATYDYAAHPVDLLTWYFGRPDTVSGTTLNRVFSAETDDEVFSTLHWGSQLHAQLSVSWSDESQRKMTTKLTIWGTNGRINVDRQECQVYLREAVARLPEYDRGWSVRYTTELTEPVDFYVRGEEYSAQIDSGSRASAKEPCRGTGTSSRLRRPTRCWRRSPPDQARPWPSASPDHQRHHRRRRPAQPPGRPSTRHVPWPGRGRGGRELDDGWGGVEVDRLLFGDNQFFGVNHMSEEKARAQAMRFQSLDAVMSVLDIAYDAGVKTFMCTTHDRVAEVTARMREDPGQRADHVFYPCMPYAHKYANAMAEDGMFGAIRQFLPDEGLLDAAMRGGRSLAKKDIDGITTLLIDAEMKMFEGLSTPVIFLQNVVVDFLLGLDFIDAFSIFAEHVSTRYGAEPGFITMNLPRLLDALDRAGVAQPDRLLEHQQARLPHVWWDRRLHGRTENTGVPRDRDVCVRLRSPAASGSHRVARVLAADRVDRVRRVQPGPHRVDRVAGRAVLVVISSPVLIANPGADVYGSDLQLLEAVSAMVGAGAEVAVVVPQSGPLVSMLEARGASVHVVRFPVLRRGDQSPRGVVTLAVACLLALPRMLRTVRSTRAQAVLVNTVTIPWWILAGRLSGRRTTCYVHEAVTDDPVAVRLALYLPLRLAHRVIMNSGASLAAVTRTISVLRSRAIVVPNGVPDRPDEPSMPLRTVPLRLGVFARLSPRKGIMDALEAVALVRSQHDVELHVYGSTFPGYESFETELRARALQPDLAGAVVFHGYVRPQWPALDAVHVVLAPSHLESAGNSVIEAMYSLRPVIASSAKGHLESITHEQTGLVVPIGDVTSIAGAISRMIEDSDLAAELSQRALRTARADHDLSAYAERITAALV